jgi:hypothetical protein
MRKDAKKLKLTLHKETLTNLDLEGIRGGVPFPPTYGMNFTCGCGTAGCTYVPCTFTN